MDYITPGFHAGFQIPGMSPIPNHGLVHKAAMGIAVPTDIINVGTEAKL